MGKVLKAALFDFDGTLVDTEGQYTEFWGAVGRELVPDVPDFAYRIKGTTLKQIFGKYFPDPSVQVEVEKKLNAFEASMQFPLYPGVVDFLKSFRANGVKCAIVTSSTRVKMAQVFRQVPSLEQLFDRVLTSEDFSASKPDPSCYLQGAKVFGCTKDECVVFEDAFNGLAAGMASGIFTFGLPTTNPASAIADKCDCVLETYVGEDYDSILARMTDFR